MENGLVAVVFKVAGLDGDNMGKLIYECAVCGKEYKVVDHEDVSGFMITTGICGKACHDKSRETTRKTEEELGIKKKKNG